MRTYVVAESEALYHEYCARHRLHAAACERVWPAEGLRGVDLRGQRVVLLGPYAEPRTAAEMIRELGDVIRRRGTASLHRLAWRRGREGDARRP